MCSLGKLAVRQVDSPVQPAGFVSVPVPALDPDPVPATVPEEVCCSSLLFLLDILSDRVFLVDSGASLSVFPGPGSTSSDGVRLHTADGSLMYCSGTRITPLYFSCGSDSRFYSWNFQLALVSVPLLGADFLQHFNLLVDVKGHWLVHAKCLESIVIQPAPDPVLLCLLSLSPQCIQKFLSKFPDLISSNSFTTSKPPPYHQTWSYGAC